MYVSRACGAFSVGDREIEAGEKSAILCEPMVEHGFRASKGQRLVVMAAGLKVNFLIAETK
jgi:hypothetical protein